MQLFKRLEKRAGRKSESLRDTLSRRPRVPYRNWRDRTAALGKALIVYLFSGSVLTAVVAYVILKGMGC